MRDVHKALITGLGAVSGYGLGAHALVDGLFTGRVGFAPAAPSVERLASSEAVLCAMVPALSAREVLWKGVRGVCREPLLLLAALRYARDDAGIRDEIRAEARHGVFVGSRRAGLDDYIHLHLERLAGGPERISPMRGPNTGFNAPASHASIQFKLLGPNLTFANGASASVDAIAHAADWVRKGRADIVYAGGVESFGHAAALERLGGTRTSTSAPKPFDARRQGSLPGEGAVIVVVESERHARARGARVLAEVRGWGMAFEPRDPMRAAARVLRNAPPRTDLVCSSAAGERGLDQWEAHAIAQARPEALVCAVNGTAGHWDGASGAVQTIAATAAIVRQSIPPTPGFALQDPELPALRTCPSERPAHVQTAVVLSTHRSGRASTLTIEAPSHE